MDPNACFQRFLDAQTEGDILKAFHAIDDLSFWYLRGGFPAKYPGSDIEVPARFVHSTVVTFKAACDQFGYDTTA